MVQAQSVRQLTAPQRAAVLGLIGAVTVADGARPLSDHLWLDLTDTESTTYTGVLAHDDADALVGYAQLQPGNGVWSLEIVVGASDDHDAATAALLHVALEHIGRHGGGAVNWWVLGGDGGTSVDAVATAAGFVMGRELHQMRRSLPLPFSTDVDVRAFEPGRDEDDWLRVNNAAFATHAEQGGWTRATLAQRESETWFDPAGFLLHEREGVLAAFCWTKVHESTSPSMGEIYAIAVDPAFHGLGLGKALTVAGLTHLAGRGLTTAMLYVDADNTAAVGLYERLGFAIHHTDRAYLTAVDPVEKELIHDR